MILQAKAVVVANVRAPNTRMTNQMRAELGSKGKMKFLTNSITKVAIKEFPGRSSLAHLVHGQVCLLYSNEADPIALFKVDNCVQFFKFDCHNVSRRFAHQAVKDIEAKHDSFAILGGAFENMCGITCAGLNRL